MIGIGSLWLYTRMVWIVEFLSRRNRYGPKSSEIAVAIDLLFKFVYSVQTWFGLISV